MPVAQTVRNLNDRCVQFSSFVNRLEQAHGPLKRSAFTVEEVDALKAQVAPWHLPNDFLELLSLDVKAAPFNTADSAPTYISNPRRLADHVSGQGHRFCFGELADLQLHCWLCEEAFDTSPVIAHNLHTDSVQVLAPSIRSWLACWSGMIELAASDFRASEWNPKDVEALAFGWSGQDTNVMIQATTIPSAFWKRLETLAADLAATDALLLPPEKWVEGAAGLGMTDIHFSEDLAETWEKVIWPGANEGHPRAG